MFARIWLMGIAVCATSPAFAQEVAPAAPSPAPAAAATAPQAATPAPPPADAKTVDKAVVAQPAAPAPAASATASASPLEGELDADKIMAAQKAGYQIKNENGQTLLCRKDLQTGSRLRHKTSCLTAREWEQLQKDNELALKSMERRPRMTRQ